MTVSKIFVLLDALIESRENFIKIIKFSRFRLLNKNRITNECRCIAWPAMGR